MYGIKNIIRKETIDFKGDKVQVIRYRRNFRAYELLELDSHVEYSLEDWRALVESRLVHPPYYPTFEITAKDDRSRSEAEISLLVGKALAEFGPRFVLQFRYMAEDGAHYHVFFNGPAKNLLLLPMDRASYWLKSVFNKEWENSLLGIKGIKDEEYFDFRGETALSFSHRCGSKPSQTIILDTTVNFTPVELDGLLTEHFDELEKFLIYRKSEIDRSFLDAKKVILSQKKALKKNYMLMLRYRTQEGIRFVTIISGTPKKTA